jgi:hypothetical protein
MRPCASAFGRMARACGHSQDRSRVADGCTGRPGVLSTRACGHSQDRGRGTSRATRPTCA